MNDKSFRNSLVELLRGGQAHSTLKSALESIEPGKRNICPQGFQHSIWQLLEHMRLAQEDILRFTIDASWLSPEFPKGYWPAEPGQMTDPEWHKSVNGFFADLEETIKLVNDESIDLTAEIPHAEGQTYLREILLIADHNSYHSGQLIQVRKALEDWSA
jgi:uncharacterized damage-inducible protein DinB